MATEMITVKMDDEFLKDVDDPQRFGVAVFDENGHEDPTECRLADDERTLGMRRICHDQRQWISEHRRSLFEGHTVLSPVDHGLARIPGEAHEKM